jgi:DNA-binding response OmpR family regulator
VVEDDERTLKLLGQVLRRGGYQSALAKSGLAAVQLLKRAVPALILLDLKMEPMDGFELLALLKKYPASASIPVVILTGRDNPYYIDRAIGFDVEDYLIKPIQPRDLLKKVGAVLRSQPKSKSEIK